MGRIEIDARTCWFWAFLLLVLPLKWLAAAFLAALFHELCHACSACLLGGKLVHMRIGPFGAQMEIYGLGRWAETLCALAGPAGSFFLLLFAPVFPLMAVCGLIQGVYNLLPVYPLDGGRAARGVLEGLFPHHGDAVMAWLERAVWTGLILAAVLFVRKFALLLILMLAHRVILRKRPCK